MKSTMKHLSLLSMGLLIYSCNEKISPELQSGNSTTVPTTVTPTEYYFRVTNNSATILNYILHRTGDGNYATDCAVKSTSTPFSSDLYVGDSSTPHDQKSYDMSCYFETEELSLLFNGLSFKVEASKNTCEYVGYSPYSYYDAIPGATTATFVGITCGDGITDVDAAPQAIAKGAIYGAGTAVSCGYMVDTSLPQADRVTMPIPEEKQDICIFDYSKQGGGNGQNCDSGKPYFTIYNVFDSNPDPVAITVSSTLSSSTRYSCGGSLTNCVEGPIKQIASLKNTSRGTEVLNSVLNEDFTHTYDLPALIGVRGANFDIVNFRKGLAAKDINFIDYSTLNDSQWSSTAIEAFDPNVMEKFASNQYADNSTIVDTAVDLPTAPTSDYESVVMAGGIRKNVYAADPYLGLNGSRINPFYTFFCFDRAFEIKARIRMVVRDWDRVFSSSTPNLELITDTHMTLASRRLDLPSSEEEVPNDPAGFNYYNDIDDWDNLVEMTRTDTNPDSYDDYISNNGAGSVLLYPTDGWWSAGIFPSQGPTK